MEIGNMCEEIKMVLGDDLYESVQEYAEIHTEGSVPEFVKKLVLRAIAPERFLFSESQTYRRSA